MKIYAVMQSEDYEGDYIHSYYINKIVARTVAKHLNKGESGYMKFFVREIEVIG